MTLKFIRHRPALVLLALALLCLTVCIGSIGFVLSQPALGLSFQADGDRLLLETGALPLAQGTWLRRISTPAGQGMDLTAGDLVEDPDLLPTYTELATFFARQAALSRLLRSAEVRLDWQTQSAQGSLVLTPRPRHLAELPLVFWYQMAVGVIGFVIAAWVYTLRPADPATRMFLVTGLALFTSAISAAVYSSRELALPETAFHGLSLLNHAGAIYFGCAFIALFALYPRRLCAPRRLFWLPVVSSVWLAADELGWLIGPSLSLRMACMLQMLAAMGLALVQWRQSQDQPLDRASLRWLMLSTLVGCSLVTLNSMLPVSLGLTPTLAQGYTFGFFLIMYLGIALGVGKYRLFDLDEWSYRILLWLAGTAAIVLGDGLLIYAGFTESTSIGLSLFLVGGLYFPFRQWLWQKLVQRGKLPLEALVPQLSRVAFLTSPVEQSIAWNEVLQHLFDPLQITEISPESSETAVLADGLTLYVPACYGLKARTLNYANRGRALFSSRDAQFAGTMGELMQQIMAGRIHYERGVEQERLRIGRDLHDNIGARLLKLIHHLRGSSGADLAREAMKDLRTAIAAIDSQPIPLTNALADWHAETEARCDAADVALVWRQDEVRQDELLPPRTKAMLESILRELATNALKHAAPTRLEIDFHTQPGRVRLQVRNDGRSGDPERWQSGYGLRNIRGRLAEFGGKLTITATATGICSAIETPLAPIS